LFFVFVLKVENKNFKKHNGLRSSKVMIYLYLQHWMNSSTQQWPSNLSIRSWIRIPSDFKRFEILRLSNIGRALHLMVQFSNFKFSKNIFYLLIERHSIFIPLSLSPFLSILKPTHHDKKFCRFRVLHHIEFFHILDFYSLKNIMMCKFI
jgi:hypothetical protein